MSERWEPTLVDHTSNLTMRRNLDYPPARSTVRLASHIEACHDHMIELYLGTELPRLDNAGPCRDVVLRNQAEFRRPLV